MSVTDSQAIVLIRFRDSIAGTYTDRVRNEFSRMNADQSRKVTSVDKRTRTICPAIDRVINERLRRVLFTGGQDGLHGRKERRVNETMLALFREPVCPLRRRHPTAGVPIRLNVFYDERENCTVH